MRSDAIVILGVGLQDSTQLHLAQDNDVVHTDLIRDRDRIYVYMEGPSLQATMYREKSSSTVDR